MKKQPLFIAYSDIHHHLWENYNQDNRRIKTSLNAEVLIFNKAAKLEIPILFMGDMFHNEKYLTNELLNWALPHYSELNLIGARWYGISGNHDQARLNIKNNESPSYVKTFSAIHSHFTCVDFQSHEVYMPGILGAFVIHGVPYITHDEGLYEHLKSIKRDKDYKNILMLHTTLPLAQDTDGRIIQTKSIGKEEMAIIKKFDLVLVGHVHKPMVLYKNKIIQVGATNQQRKTDRNCELGYYIFYDDLSYDFKAIKAPKFVELKAGTPIPDNDNYYYHEVSKIKKVNSQNEREKDFASPKTDPTKMVKAYLEVKGEKSKQKRVKLIHILKQGHDQVD